MDAPRKPFPEYKWRWATFVPTEGLNAPPVFLGVLRALRAHEGLRPTDEDLLSALQEVEADTQTPVNLARDASRNLIRNSGQYWKGLGVFRDTRSGIRLTEFGRNVADGALTPVEFAVAVVKTLQLPNATIEGASTVAKWKQAGLVIKPLELILSILAELSRSRGPAHAYITPSELTRLVVPLAGENSPVSRHVEAIQLLREGALDISSWPDCTPAANDSRMAREFLLFLWHYGFLRQEASGSRPDEKYFLAALGPDEVHDLIGMQLATDDSMAALRQARDSDLPSTVERTRVLAEVLARPGQSRFRREVLRAYSSTCLLTGLHLPNVLIAAHIMPVKNDGSDSLDNGICLRADVHLLFDAGHLRIDPAGGVHLSETASQVDDYRRLPSTIVVPPFVNVANIRWRWKYL